MRTMSTGNSRRLKSRRIAKRSGKRIRWQAHKKNQLWGNMMKIFLIEPPKTVSVDLMKRSRPTAQPPLGLAYIAAILEQNNYDVRILDCIIEDPNCAVGTKIDDGIVRFGLSDTDIAKHIKDFDPDIVGVSAVLSIKYRDAKNVCRIAKEVNPNIITIMGGAHPTSNINVLDDPNLDYIVGGEGDYSCLELIQYLEGKRDISTLDGIGMKIDGKIKVIPKTKFIQNLDELPFPARHLLPIEKYWKVNLPHGESTRTPWTSIVTSRGCPGSCFYCSAHMLWGRRYRSRSVENVLREIKMLIDTYGIRELLIEDDNFTFDKARTGGILDRIIKNGWDLTWTTPNGTAIFALDAELLRKIKQSGCTSLTIAVESGSQRILSNIVRKPLNLDRVEKIAREAKEAGLKLKAFYMIGIPGETKEEMDATLAVARRIKADWSCFSIATPLPGTEMYEVCRRKGYVKDIDMTDIEYTTARIRTEEFDEDYVNQKWQEANNINFLENPNFEGDINQAIHDFERVLRMVPDHKMAREALERALKIKTERNKI